MSLPKEELLQPHVREAWNGELAVLRLSYEQLPAKIMNLKGDSFHKWNATDMHVTSLQVRGQNPFKLRPCCKVCFFFAAGQTQDGLLCRGQ